MKRWLLILIVALAAAQPAGCERATRQIDRDQARIESLARLTTHELEESIAHLDAARETGAIGEPAQSLLDRSIQQQQDAIAYQDGILHAAGRTRLRLADVEDRVHPLVRLAQTWGSVALIVAVIALLVYLGVGPLIRRAFQYFGLLIPRPVQRDAKFDAEAITDGSACQLDRQRIAARRAADRAYERAFIMAKEQCERQARS